MLTAAGGAAVGAADMSGRGGGEHKGECCYYGAAAERRDATMATALLLLLLLLAPTCTPHREQPAPSPEEDDELHQAAAAVASLQRWAERRGVLFHNHSSVCWRGAARGMGLCATGDGAAGARLLSVPRRLWLHWGAAPLPWAACALHMARLHRTASTAADDEGVWARSLPDSFAFHPLLWSREMLERRLRGSPAAVAAAADRSALLHQVRHLLEDQLGEEEWSDAALLWGGACCKTRRFQLDAPYDKVRVLFVAVLLAPHVPYRR